MKIFILPINRIFQPDKQPFLYPKYNRDYGVEQDFLEYLYENPEVVTNDYKSADWHYLPVFWTRYHLNRNHDLELLKKLQTEVNLRIIDDKRTFTVCQFDDGPIVNIGSSLQCLSSKKDSTVHGINIPLLASPIPNVTKNVKNISWLGSFLGQYKNHQVRFQLNKLLRKRSDIYFSDGDLGIEYFVEKTLQSFIGICPRGYGGSSFRLYEVMQLGRVPIIISDVDIRPFKSHVNWEEFSFFIQDVTKIDEILERASKLDLLEMGEKANQVWELLTYKNWCKYLIAELCETNYNSCI